MTSTRSRELQNRLQEAVQGEIPRHQKLQTFQLDPALVAAIAGLISMVVQKVVDRCSQENAFETVAGALISSDRQRREKAERILKVRTQQELRRNRDYSRLRETEFADAIPEIAVDSLVIAVSKSDEDDRLDYVIEHTSYDLL